MTFFKFTHFTCALPYSIPYIIIHSYIGAIIVINSIVVDYHYLDGGACIVHTPVSKSVYKSLKKPTNNEL